MIRIGLNEKQKQEEIKKYVKENNIKNVIVFSPKNMFMKLPKMDIPIRQIDYDEIIMYRTFYPLLEEIGKNHLLIANELMRDKNRNCLTYNCYAKYTNQTEHRIAFNYFPIISERRDIMILIDFINSQQHKGFGINNVDISKYDIKCIRKDIELSIVDIPLPESALDEYNEEKERLFDKLGNKSPDTIPRNLHIWTGKFKKHFLNNEEEYVARNKRFNKKNVITYKSAEVDKNYILVDMPCRRMEFNDFLQKTRQENLQYISTGFGVDKVYIKELEDWIEEVENIYAETGIYTG